MASSAFIPSTFSSREEEAEILSLYVSGSMYLGARPMLVTCEGGTGERPYLRMLKGGRAEWVASPLHATRWGRGGAESLAQVLAACTTEPINGQWGLSFGVRSFRSACKARAIELSW